MGQKLASSCGADLISCLFVDIVCVTAASDGGLHPSEDNWSVGEAQPELLSCLLARLLAHPGSSWTLPTLLFVDVFLCLCL